MKVLVIGGTGPTGLPIVRGLLDAGHEVTLLNRGLHPKPELAGIPTITADPYDEASFTAAIGDTTWDTVAAMYGRLRMIARSTKGKCANFLSVGGVPAYRGWTDPWQWDPAGLPVPVREDAALVDLETIDSKGYRIVRTEEAVFDAHPTAAHFRYPYMYGPWQPVPREWSIVRRVLDGRTRIIVPDDGLTLHHHGYTENVAAAVLRALLHPELAAGTIFNVGDEEVLTIRQVVELCARALGADLEIVSMPYDLAVPAWPLMAQPLPTHRVMDLSLLHHQLGHRDVVPAREGIRRTARWLADHRPEQGGTEETVLTDPFDYAAEDALIDSWLAARASVVIPEFATKPTYGLAYSGPMGRPRTQKEFVE